MCVLVATFVLMVTLVGTSVSPVAGDPMSLSRSPRRESAAFHWPVDPHEMTRPFQAPAHAYAPGHRGVDLLGDTGQPVLAAGSGLVRYAGRLVDRDVISLEHPGGLRTTYEPVEPTVTVGQQVFRGEQIGWLRPGHPSCSAPKPKACLHWGARRDQEYLDPLRLLDQGRLRLLPWDDPPG